MLSSFIPSNQDIDVGSKSSQEHTIDDYYYAFINFMNMYKLGEYMDNYMDLNILSCYAFKDLEELNILNDMFNKEVKPWLIENVNL